MYADEAQQPNKPDSFDAINPEEVSKTIEKFNQGLTGRTVDTKVKQKLNYAKNNRTKNIAKYNQQEVQMGHSQLYEQDRF